MRQILLLLLMAKLAFSGISISGGPIYFVSHSENNEPTLMADPYKYGWSGSFEYRHRLDHQKMLQLVLGFTEVSSTHEYLAYDADGNSLNFVKAGSFRERSFPLILRYFTSARGLTGYGIGPLLSVTEHQFNYIPPYPYSQFSFIETFYSTGLGINALIRFATPMGKSLFSHIDLEVQGVQAIHFQNAGQDMSNYTHNTFQIKLSLGLGNR